MAFCAAAAAVARAEPSLWSYLALVFLQFAILAATLLGVAEGAGKVRAFWLGAAVPIGIVAFVITWIPLETVMSLGFQWPSFDWSGDMNNPRAVALLSWAFASINGFASVALYWLIWQKSPN